MLACLLSFIYDMLQHFHQFINLFASLLLLLLFLSHSTSPNILLARNKVYLFTQNNDKIAIGFIKIWVKTVLFIESLCLGLTWRRMRFFVAFSLCLWSHLGTFVFCVHIVCKTANKIKLQI